MVARRRCLNPLPSLLRRSGPLVAIVGAGCVSGSAPPAAAQQVAGDEPPRIAGRHGADADVQFADPATLDSSIPTPESIIGYPVGSKAVRYDELVRYLEALAAASDLVTLSTHGMTHEGRLLYHVTITSVANHARLDRIQADNAKLADPRTLAGSEEAQQIIDNLPGIAWLAYSIHGDEVSQCDAAMQLAYQLAAGTDESTRSLRNELVIHIDPSQNPDGRERYLSQIETLIGKVPNPDIAAMHHAGLWSAGRGNHYLFDMNRDWLMQTQPETRGRSTIIQDWNPHLVVDAHEMGSLDTYLFDPPREPLNLQISHKLWDLRRMLSRDQAAAFNEHGWSYYTKEWYDEWYPGYTNAWASLIGAAGLLYEQAGVSGSIVKRPSGELFTYRLAVKQNVTSSLANLETLRANRIRFLREFYEDRLWALSEQPPFTGTFLLPPGDDPSRRDRLIDLLDRQRIEYTIAADSFDAGDATDIWGQTHDSIRLPPGTLIVRSQQPRRRMIHAILGFDPRMTDEFLLEERNDLEKHKGTRIYDVTAWNLAMAYGLDAYWAARVPDVATHDEPTANSPLLGSKEPAYGFLIDCRNSAVQRALVRLYAHSCKVRAATEPFTIDDREYPAGTLLLRRHENPDELPQLMQEIASTLKLSVYGLDTALAMKGPDLGGRKFVLLHPPRVAIASQWPISTTSFGATWWLLDDRLGLRASPVNAQSLGSMDLRRYNVLILPASSGALRAVLAEGGFDKLRQWVQAGGTLIALGGSAAMLTDEELDFSEVRLRRDVLDKLDEYAEALDREQAARKITIDPASVWGVVADEDARDDEDGLEDQERPAEAEETDKPPSEDIEQLKRQDEWQRLFSPRGSFVAATLDDEHWLCYGLDNRLPVLVSGGSVFMAKTPGATPARLESEHALRLGGLIWPEARSRLADSAYATVERMGDGQVILFAGEPFFRGYLEGPGRLLTNAVLLGPGMGTNQPLPW
ncbi:MAG: hypothetical protein IH985_07225 [Planctomycetes bacterium]|nr:hypothetical protein [Planctomycetota bacterium]